MKIFIKNIAECSKNRFILFVLFLVIFIVSNWFFTGNLLPSPETKNLWFYSGIFMVIFSILFIEPYYTSPKNVITNAIPLLLVFLAIENSFENKIFWNFTVVVLVSLLATSIFSMAIEDKNKSPEHWKNKLSERLKKIVVLVGQGKILYSSVFIYFLLTYYSIQNYHTLFLFVLWFLILLIDPKKIKSTFSITNKKHDESAIGEIFGVQSKKIFLVKLFEDRKVIQKFDIVKFRYSMQDIDDLAITGIVFDTYLLNKEKWTKILQLGIPQNPENNLEKNVVYKVLDKEEKDRIDDKLNINNFVGIIIEGSKIGKVKFEYSKKQDDLQEGDLLELNVGKQRLFYQVITGFTEKEKLEARNETGFIEGEAIQLGEWKNDELSFRKFGWVPSINTPIFKADTKDIALQDFSYPEFKLGVIPNTTLPSIINLEDAISHHLALLGVTGSGKTFLAHEIIKQLKQDTKIICVDFTGEWKNFFNPEEVEDFETINAAITSDKISLIELDSVSNTTQSLEETNKKLQEIFTYAKENQECKKICLVLEEAHTIVPETTFLGDYGSFSANKALVNKMSQIALQGRKFGIGLLVIAQRTANVSKTVLTQCNTVICFQAFDETSFNFLGNYIGKDLVQTLPSLKQYHAIVTGKAVRSNLPMIIDLTVETEDEEQKT